MMKFRRLSMFDLLTKMELSDCAKNEIRVNLEGTDLEDVGNACLSTKRYVSIYLSPETVNEMERALHHAGLRFDMTHEELYEYENRRWEEHYSDNCRQNWKNHKGGYKKNASSVVHAEAADDLYDFLVGKGKFEGVNDRCEALDIYINILKDIDKKRAKFGHGWVTNRIKD